MAPETIDREKLKDALDEDAMNAYDDREQQIGEELMRYLERSILLQVIDNRWREHLYDMDYLREGIHLRGFAQIDPLVAYKNEGFAMFEELMHSIWEEFSKLIFNAQIELDPSRPQGVFGGNGGRAPAALDYSGGTPEAQPSALQEVAAGGGTEVVGVTAGAPPANGGGNGAPAPSAVETVVKDEREKDIGRNDPCWCGSGKKVQEVPRRLAALDPRPDPRVHPGVQRAGSGCVCRCARSGGGAALDEGAAEGEGGGAALGYAEAWRGAADDRAGGALRGRDRGRRRVGGGADPAGLALGRGGG